MSSTITLDTAAGDEYGFAINNGEYLTNQISVTLTIGAEPKTTQMQVSNDSNFGGAAWEPFSTRKPWLLSRTPYASGVVTDTRMVYVRYKVIDGVTSSMFKDDRHHL